MMRSLRNENGSSLRGLCGQGEPGLYTLLGGTGIEEDASGYTFTGGAGQVSSVARLAKVHKDVRLAAIAAGNNPDGSTGSGPGLGPAGGSGSPKPLR